MIIFVTTCKGRAFHIKQTLPRNLADNSHPDSRFLILDYNSGDDLISYLKQNHAEDIASGRLIVYSYPSAERFHVAHAKNLAHRLAMFEGADILVTLDADNYTGPAFDHYILSQNLAQAREIFLRPGMIRRGEQRFVRGSYGQIFPQKRGIAGRLVIRAQEFVKAGGYNERYDTWRGEDMDLNARLGRMGYIARDIDPVYLDAVTHNAEVRFKEYPHARLLYENNNVLKEINSATDTLVNFGNIGCGVAYRNFGSTPTFVKPLPTRVFGIGLHKTATTSLHRAFQLFGYDSLHWGTGEAPRIWQEVNKFGTSPTLEKYYALSDLPIPLLYRRLDLAYPGSKFILTLRDEAKWVKSVQGLFDHKTNPTRWTWDVYPITNRLHHVLYGRVDFDAPTMVTHYRRHNAEVLNYFKDRPEDLLVLDMDKGAGWTELCEFLSQPIPNIPYPREYATKELS